MGAIVLLLISGTSLGMCVYALVRARRGLAEALRIDRLVEETAQTRIADAPSSGRIHIVGRATGAGGAVVTAPFTGADAVWARAMLQSNIGQLVQDWVEHVEAIEIDDGSGRVARVRLRGASVRMPEVSVGGQGHDDRIAAYLGARGWDNSGDNSYFEHQAVLPPGETVSVIGTARAAEGAYRESGATLSLSSADGELLIFDPDMQARRPEEHRRNAGCAVFGIVFFAAVMLVTALVAYAR